MPRVLEEVESESSIDHLFQHIPGVSVKFVAFITELGDGHGKKSNAYLLELGSSLTDSRGYRRRIGGM